MSRRALVAMLAVLAGCPGGTGPSIKHETLDATGDGDGDGDSEDGRASGEGGGHPVAVVVPTPDAPDAPEPPPPGGGGEVGVSRVDMSDEAVASAVRPHLSAAESAASASDWDRVITEARGALHVDGTNVDAVLLLTRAYYHKEWYTKAQAIVEQATAVSPGSGSAPLWMIRGLVAEALGSPLDQVASHYKEAVRLRPKYARAWTNLGAVYIAQEQYGDAISALKTALSQDPDLVSAHTNLGTAFRREAIRAKPADRDGLLLQAEEAYNAAIRTDEMYAPAHLNLGILYLDSDPFPDKDDIERLRAAVSSLTDYKELAGSGQTQGAEYLSAAQRQLRSFVTAKKRKSKK